MKKLIGLLVVLVAIGGCMSTARQQPAFSKGWAHQIEKDREFQSRRVWIDGKKAKETGDGGSIAEEGQAPPTPAIGGKNGLGADFDTGGGKVLYGINW